jgi:Zn finger protein HypA/HybF involved in hydrogenase expression
MAKTPCLLKLFVMLALAAAGALLLLPAPVSAQEEVASAIRRYKDREASTGYYEEHEVRPRRIKPLVGVPGVEEGIFNYSPTAAKVRNRSHLADSHMGIAFYKEKTCQTCHPEQAKDIHTVRANLTCRQCHGGEPIASNQYFKSPMNPIRKHAYVCAKCHEGSSASFASYIVHEPAPGSAAARKGFPILYFTYWFMTVLLVGTLAFFIPHSFLTGLRELFNKKRTTNNDAADAH